MKETISMKRQILVASFLLLVIALGITAYKLLPGPGGSKATGEVTGRIGIRDVGPMMGGTVFFINTASGPPPSTTGYWRVPTDSFPLEENAHFRASLPEGEYFMGAIERDPGVSPAPPGEGEYYFISRDGKGAPKTYTVRNGEVLDLGDLVVRADPFKRSLLDKKGVTSIQGVLRNEKGEPVPGLLVFSYTGPSMNGKPIFVSERSDGNGNYVLRLAGAGTFYLQARSAEGGHAPAGVYADGKPVRIEKAEAKKDVDITVRTEDATAPAH